MKHRFFNFSTQGDTADLMIFGAIGYDVDAAEVVRQVNAARAGGVEKLNVYIDSPGGSIFSGMDIFHAIQSMDATVYIYGLAASMGSVIAMAGAKTYIAPHGFLMIHNPSAISIGDQKSLEKDAALLGKFKMSIIEAYQKKTHKTESEIIKMMDDETWMNAEQALEAGFVDAILDSDQAAGNLVGSVSAFANMVADALSEKFKAKFQNFPKTEKKTMLTKEALQALGLAEDAADDQISAAIAAKMQNSSEPDPTPDDNAVAEIKNLIQDIAQKVDGLEKQIADESQNKIGDLVDAAVAAYKIKAGERDVWVAALEKDFDGAKEKLDAIEANAVKPAKTKTGENENEPDFKTGTLNLIAAATQQFKDHGRK